MQNNNCNDNPSICNGAFIWLLFIIILFRGLPLNNNLFWEGYNNAFSSSTFNKNSIFNKIYPNSIDFNDTNNIDLNNFTNTILNSNFNNLI